MKHLLLLLAVITLIETAYAQHLPQTEQPTKEYYLKKAKRQRTASIVMVAGGGAIALGSSIAFMALDLGDAFTTNKGDAYLVTGIVGIASMFGSIPVFISAKKNRKKAEAISASFIIKPERSSMGNYIGTAKSYPAIGLQIKF